MWERQRENDNKTSMIEKIQKGDTIWESNFLAVEGEMRPDNCSYTAHRMHQTKDREWIYIYMEKEKSTTRRTREEGRQAKRAVGGY